MKTVEALAKVLLEQTTCSAEFDARAILQHLHDNPPEEAISGMCSEVDDEIGWATAEELWQAAIKAIMDKESTK